MIRVYFIRKGNTQKNGIKDTVLGRLILRYGLRKDYGINDDIDIQTDDKGKPYLTEHRDIYFNISHTSAAVAVAVCKFPVGLDTETVSNKKYLGVIKGMFTENECEYTGNDSDRFYDIWTRKESYVKLTGNGIDRRMREFDVLTGENTCGAVFIPVSIPDTKACVCSYEKDTVEVHELFINDIEGVLNDCI